MLREIRHQGRWRCFASPNSAKGITDYITSLGSLDALLQSIDELPTTFKDNHRSRVLSSVNAPDAPDASKSELFPPTVFAKSVVAKQPKNKNQSAWSRALSLFRSGEARQTFLALQRFGKLGVKAGQPILVLEKRRFGMIVDSWVVYEYLAGEPCTSANLPQIIDILAMIHEAGYQHKDPTLGNFYLDGEGKLFVIDCVLRQGLGNFSRCRDLMMLVDNNDSIHADQVEPELRRYRSTPGYAAYALYRGYRRLRDVLKYKLRGRKPKNN